MIALHCARLHVPDKKPKHDALIAATALVYGLVLVTNDADFNSMGVALSMDDERMNAARRHAASRHRLGMMMRTSMPRTFIRSTSDSPQKKTHGRHYTPKSSLSSQLRH